MAHITGISSSSISSAFEQAVNLTASWAESDPPLFWFRGVKNRDLGLQPGAYWRPSYNEIEPLVVLTQDGVAFGDIKSLEDWNTYYLAQHHGIPTRLLDWTESFAAALFFAFDGWDGITVPCVWVLQPTCMNKVFLDWEGIIAPENYSEMRIWLPKEINKPSARRVKDKSGYVYDNKWPLAIYPKKTNHRMLSQQGQFTVHGRNRKSIDELITQKRGTPEKILSRIDLEGFDANKIVRQLSMLGIRRSSLYPDLDNFVKQLRDYYNW